LLEQLSRERSDPRAYPFIVGRIAISLETCARFAQGAAPDTRSGGAANCQSTPTNQQTSATSFEARIADPRLVA
jgi:hypothetical protein